jgi:mRNA interferase YafQ
MVYKLFKSNQFKRSYKKLQLSDSDEQAFIDVAFKLLNAITLDVKYKEHALTGNFAQYKECHIKPDLLLIYMIDNATVKLVDIGTHSELFG